MSGTLKVGGKTLATHDTDNNVAKIQLGSTSDVVLTDSAGNNVLSESGGVVTLTADAAVIEGSSSGDLVRITQTGTGNALVVEDSANPDSTPFVVDSSGNVGIGTSPSYNLHVASTTSGSVIKAAASSATTSASSLILSGYRNGADQGVLGRVHFTNQNTTDTTVASIQGFKEGNSAIDRGYLAFYTKPTSGSLTERMRIDSSGNVLVGKTNSSLSNAGAVFNPVGLVYFTRASGSLGGFNRTGNDGVIVSFYQDETVEGDISVSGSTVSYNGGHLSRWSQLSDNTRDESIVKGTVMSNLDQMAEWTNDGVTEDNEQLNCMKVSDVEGDIDVAGVFVNWDNDDDIYVNDMNIAMTGDMVIRIAQGTTVQRGDLLMSAGDGTAKPQGDDIVRSKTIAKVTSIHISHTYEDGSYLVPCVLMAC